MSGSLTKSGFDRRVHKARPFFVILAHLRPPAREEHRYRDMLMRLRQDTAFVKSHDAKFIELGRMSRGPKEWTAAQRLLRPIQHSLTVETEDAHALGLGACATERSTSSVTIVTLTSS
ncbi:MAG TPA: hypothetical protein VKR79_09460 [Gaiellaceae bacterium]|nr:hypothetical protein [Gaiellaceae bacterium]